MKALSTMVHSRYVGKSGQNYSRGLAKFCCMFVMNQLVRKEIDLRGTFNYNADELEEACQWLVDDRFDPDLLVTHRCDERGRGYICTNDQKQY